jgi:hypothetical protein
MRLPGGMVSPTAFARLCATLLVAASLLVGPVATHPVSAAATCASSTGPGIPPPAGYAVGIPGFHAQWYGQSGYPTLCPGTRSTATVAYYNSGSQGWVSGKLGEVAYLGTWSPEPGQDRASPLGGDGALGSPNTGWPRYNRIAMQPAPYVGPGQVAWFQFTIQAPVTPGYYRLYLRPLIEGATWMEDVGVFWSVTVLNADGTLPPKPVGVYSPTGSSTLSVPTPRGTFTTHLIKERLADVTVKTVTANASYCANNCPVKPLDQFATADHAYAAIHGTYLCPPDYAACAGKVNSYDYAMWNSDLGTWINKPALIVQNGLLIFNGKTPTYYRRAYVYGQGPTANQPITAGITMFMLLLQGGAILDISAEQTAKQQEREMKGSIGTDGTYIYLVITENASLVESQFVLQALGVQDALNLDGGGTSAMWINGQYTVGPGRLLPNAILLTKP